MSFRKSQLSVCSFFIDDFRLLDVPYPLIDQNPDWEGYFEWGKPWYGIDEDDPEQNPWRVHNEALMVPFDTQVRQLQPTTCRSA